MKVLITGGASGLGAAITSLLAKDEGYFIYFTYSNSIEKAQLLEQQLKNVTAIKCDFTISEEIEALKNLISELQIDVLINNAYSGNPVKPTSIKFRNAILPKISASIFCQLLPLHKLQSMYFERKKKAKSSRS